MSVPDDFDFETNLTRRRLIAYAVILVVLAIVFLPTAQNILYLVFVATPSVLQWGVVALVIAGVAYYVDSRPLFMLAIGVFVVMGVFVGPFTGAIYAHDDVAHQMQQGATHLDTLPNTSKQNIRMLPRSVADNYAQSSMQYPQYKLTGSDIAYENGTYDWSYGIVPDSFFVSWFGNQKGAMYVNMTTTNKQIHVKNAKFTNGRGQLFFDSFQYQSVLHAPLQQHDWDTTFNARANGTSYIAHSTTTYQWKFQLLPIPELYAVPRFGGVQLMHTNGQIDSLTPQQAEQSPLLHGQNVYPYTLAMYKVNSMQYVHGALNKWFWKQDVLKVAPLPEGSNHWPLVVPTEGTPHKLTYFVATEPTGSGNGVYQIWTFDGQTGTTGVQQYDNAQIGPRRAVDFVGRDPQVNRLSNAQVVSPIPIVKGNTLYWHVKVVPGSNSGVVYTAFVNADTGDVTLLQGDKPVYAFMTKAEVNQVGNQTSGPAGSGTTVRVVVTDANGTIVGTKNITVPKGGNVQVNVHNNATANNNSTNGSA